MHKAAKADGISLVIISATRNFDYQKKIWQSKWTGRRLVDKKNLAKTVPDPVERAYPLIIGDFVDR
jgi:LAS superfamily LD-carboxypeptidase LdcB